MTAEKFIGVAIDRGQSLGADALSALERTVFLISEVEVYCTKDGIDSFIVRYDTAGLRQASEAFAMIGATEVAAALEALARAGPEFPEPLLERANNLVVDHVGWDYDTIHAAVSRQLER